jgi:two-component system OmpR family sensor kinase
VLGVELGLQLLLHNLLVNAIRYTPVGGRIEIGCARDSQAILLTVDDSGPGIPASQHAQAFQRFNRLGRVDAHGVGLGLSIVQAVAHAHNAVVHLRESPLGGLRAEVRFPAPPAQPA